MQPKPALSPTRPNQRSFATLRVVMALVLREMSSRYGKSTLGFLWALLEPLGGILILGLGFSLLVRSPPLGGSFFLFYATGFLPFSIYQNVAGMVSRSIEVNRPLLVYPAVTWVDAVIARFLLNFLTGVMVTCVLLTGLLMVVAPGTSISMGPLIEATCLAGLVGLSVGMVNCVLTGLWPSWAQIWSIITRPLFLASGVIFMYEDMPHIVQQILWWNPLFHITSIMREGIYPTYTAGFASVTFVCMLSLLGIFFATLLLGRSHRRILNA